jgi:hypothetical protein
MRKSLGIIFIVGMLLALCGCVAEVRPGVGYYYYSRPHYYGYPSYRYYYYDYSYPRGHDYYYRHKKRR